MNANASGLYSIMWDNDIGSYKDFMYSYVEYATDEGVNIFLQKYGIGQHLCLHDLRRQSIALLIFAFKIP